eukprot:366180-Chlamydomonas_euryale.AAC.3
MRVSLRLVSCFPCSKRLQPTFAEWHGWLEHSHDLRSAFPAAPACLSPQPSTHTYLQQVWTQSVREPGAGYDARRQCVLYRLTDHRAAQRRNNTAVRRRVGAVALLRLAKGHGAGLTWRQWMHVCVEGHGAGHTWRQWMHVCVEGHGAGHTLRQWMHVCVKGHGAGHTLRQWMHVAYVEAVDACVCGGTWCRAYVEVRDACVCERGRGMGCCQGEGSEATRALMNIQTHGWMHGCEEGETEEDWERARRWVRSV